VGFYALKERGKGFWGGDTEATKEFRKKEKTRPESSNVFLVPPIWGKEERKGGNIESVRISGREKQGNIKEQALER